MITFGRSMSGGAGIERQRQVYFSTSLKPRSR
jgi:hypothetical protein